MQFFDNVPLAHSAKDVESRADETAFVGVFCLLSNAFLMPNPRLYDLGGIWYHYFFLFSVLLHMDPFVQAMTTQHIWETSEWETLKQDVPEVTKLHLRDLLQVSVVLCIDSRTRTASLSSPSSLTESLWITAARSSLPR